MRRLPGFAPTTPGVQDTPGAPITPGALLLPQEITCESVEGENCRSRCDGLDRSDGSYDSCYSTCLADRCRDPAWWPSGGTP
ncbi:hypothetical protein ABT354_12460 [Streptomyces sp. NPDC000594]|uniref:hypothetical protein n=1 Tax=Streptomyces sp. NPDC000594 TaxID=3154261 RepID=UPI00332BA567